MMERTATPKNKGASLLRKSTTVKWTEQDTSQWQFIGEEETVDQRCNRYTEYLKPTDGQVKTLAFSIQDYLKKNVQEGNVESHHHKVQNVQFKDDGVAYGLDLGSKTIVACRIVKKGQEITVEEKFVNLTNTERDLTSENTTAYDLFDEMSKVVAELTPPTVDPSIGFAPIAFVCSFKSKIRSPTSMDLISWSKGMATGRNTDDPVEGSDMAAMLDCAFRRNQLPFRVAEVMGDVVSAGILGVTQLQDDTESCAETVRFVMNMGTGFNIGSLVSPAFRAQSTSIGDCIDLRVQDYAGDIPRLNVDLEIDWANGADSFAENPLEKMCSAKFLGEVSRRVLLKIFRSDSPQAMWSREIIPAEIAKRWATDDPDNFDVIIQSCKVLLDWEIDYAKALIINQVCQATFTRSASIVAASLCAVAKEFNGLTPALGASVVAVSGKQFNSGDYYADLVREKIEVVLGPILNRLLILKPVTGGSSVGAALTLLKKGN